MSEAEKKRRLDYRTLRKQRISVQVILLAVLLLIAMVSGIAFFRLDKDHYINYTEKSTVDYGVYLKDNEFYDKDYIGKDQAYVASLIDAVIADFKYELCIFSAEEIEFSYTYRIDAVLEIKDRASGGVLYEPSYEIIPETTAVKSGRELAIREIVELDYDEYNERANRFINTYNLSNVDSRILLKMQVAVEGASAEFDNETQNNAYVVTLDIPLTTKTVNVDLTSSVKEGEHGILARYTGVARTVFRVVAIVFACLSLLLAIELVAFIYLTRNTDITYEIRVNRLVKSYKPFIQRLQNEFNTAGYQMLLLSSFEEMLEIRDTIQSPILLFENADKTCTSFFIPTNTKILYLFEIKVEDYDELYGMGDGIEENGDTSVTPVDNSDAEVIPAEKSELSAEEELLLLDEVDEEALAEALSAPDVILSEIDYVDNGVEEEAMDGVEVVDVVWKEKENGNELHRYDPNGVALHEGDLVLVPDDDEAQEKKIVRKAAVAHGNHKVAPPEEGAFRKIVGIIRRKVQDALKASLR